VDLSQNIKFNGGGHLNHEFFWESLSPTSDHGGKEPTSGKLSEMITENFGDIATFKTKFSGVAAAIQGSGWAWLCYSR
jgi:Fe-Mn family superoxide dismutase